MLGFSEEGRGGLDFRTFSSQAPDRNVYATLNLIDVSDGSGPSMETWKTFYASWVGMGILKIGEGLGGTGLWVV